MQIVLIQKFFTTFVKIFSFDETFHQKRYNGPMEKRGVDTIQERFITNLKNEEQVKGINVSWIAVKDAKTNRPK